ncbi:MAG TPA: Gfo/Idh/MocA family oxidoreductase [Aggregatilineales bacterium]|nr:Gfo/Idh/MocA family oxidoreductase [Anaerolineales bacterium]HRE47041.1 Gfo/Idh/MocA family oxidoreductase [Aggregatilineales bacterium]
MSTNTIRAAVIGLGVGGAHLRGYQVAPGVEIVGICDSNPARLAEIGEKHNLPESVYFTDYETLFKEAKPTLVSIALPNALHAPVSIAAMAAGADVLCEKPLAMTSAEVHEMVKTAEHYGRRLMVSYNHRYRADVFWIRRLMAEGRLGRIYQIEASWRRETGIPGWGWFGSQAMSGGGAMIDLGVHVLDMALWLLDYPKVVSVNGATRSLFGKRGQKVWGEARWLKDASSVFDVDDGGIGFLRLGTGVTMVLQATWAEHKMPNEDLIRLEIQGSEGTAILSVPNYTKQDTVTFYTEIGGAPVTVTPHIRWDGHWFHERLIAEIVTAIQTDTPPPTTGEQGLVGVQVIEAIYHAAQSGREVVFPG